MKWRSDLGYSAETILILDIAGYFIGRYFSRNDADELLNAYFDAFGEIIDEDYVMHKMSWGMATEIYFSIALKGDRCDLVEWERDNGWLRTPPDALEYLRVHYWNRSK